MTWRMQQAQLIESISATKSLHNKIFGNATKYSEERMFWQVLNLKSGNVKFQGTKQSMFEYTKSNNKLASLETQNSAQLNIDASAS